MSFTFKLSHRLAKNFWVVGIAAMFAGCTVENSIANPSTPPDTSTVTPPAPPSPQPKPMSGFFVATNGSGAASGNLAAPWDLTTALNRLAPENAGWRHDTEGPDDMPAHIKTMLTGTSLHIPVLQGALALGTWQAIYLIEHRARPHRREIVLQFAGSVD